MGQDAEPALYRAGVRHKLLSYADVDTWGKDAFKFWIHSAPPDARVFFDSGAFSAWSRGATIDIRQYIAFVKEYRHNLGDYANLDVIGDWKRSARNLDVLLSEGLQPTAVFHRGSPWNELDRLASLGLPVALGGLVGRGRSQSATAIKPYLDECWSHLKHHWPVRVHVLGIVSQWVLERYPWFSADSSTAIVTAGLGKVRWWEDGRSLSDNYISRAKRVLDGSILDHVATDRATNGSAHMGRRLYALKAQLSLEQHVTALWAARGISWDGDRYTGTLP